jgi:hypothetical protein
MPTPESGSTTASRPNKRRRTDDYNHGNSGIYEDDVQDEVEEREQEAEEQDHNEEEQDEDAEEQQEEASAPTPVEQEEQRDQFLYDPNQNVVLRRNLLANMRENQREIDGEYHCAL